MKTYHDCVPCFIRQTLDAARAATPDQEVHEAALREILKAAVGMGFTRPPPVMGQRIQHLIQALTGVSDPFKGIKDQYNRYALGLYPDLKELVEKSSGPFETAARLAIAGNIIDFGADIEVNPSIVDNTISSSLKERVFGSLAPLQAAVKSAGQILYVGDNAGEIVFDRLLIEQLPAGKVTFVVRGGPVVNDATMADAEDTGMTDLVKVIDTGSDMQGIIFEECSDEFRRSFDRADLIVSKGQGNYETLSNIKKPIFFLLKAKCPVVARHIGCDLGSMVAGRAEDFTPQELTHHV
jgi:uncharacterized protein with ATP-grasp and redox domains